MIKTIKKIDLQGNETWQEVIVCNRCKKTLESTDYVYETKWTGVYPVKMASICACGFGEWSNPTKHICECCQKEVEDFINGKDTLSAHKLTTFKERVAMSKQSLINENTEALKEFRHNLMCSVETGAAIDEILKERQGVEVK
jgi:hypothetical protein